MAHAFFTPENVRQACQAKLDSLTLWRERVLRQHIDRQMTRTMFSFRKMGRVHVFANEDEALADLKDSSRDFFGTTYDMIMVQMGRNAQEAAEDLFQLADKAGTPVALTTADVELIGNYLILEGK